MRTCLVLLMLGWGSIAAAQCLTPESERKNWNFDDPSLQVYWEFKVAVEPPPTGFRLKIGTSPGVYTITRDFKPNEFAVRLSELVPGPGRYYAVVAPLDGAREGGAGKECPFVSSRTELQIGVRKMP